MLEAFEDLKLKYIYLEEKAIENMEDEEVKENRTEEVESLKQIVEETEGKNLENEEYVWESAEQESKQKSFKECENWRNRLCQTF